MNDVQLVVRTDQGRARPCATFTGLALSNPVLIEFCHVGTSAARAAMDALVDALIAELQTGGRASAVAPPCGGHAGQCHAIGQPDCHKLLVLVGDTRTVAPLSTPLLAQWLGRGADFAILPILPQSARRRAMRLLPSPLDAINAVFWDQAVEEALPAVLQVGGITASPRIFISYRQSDTAGAAIQLFDALSHDGFDVFLDHFRIAPGVDFQARLRQELGDKAMVLVLESPNLARSPWVAFEIAEAKAVGLGLAAVSFPSAPPTPGIDPQLRLALGTGDVAPDGTILPPALENVRSYVRREHDRALLRRRIALEQSFEQAVIRAGGAPPDRHSDGSFEVRAPSCDYRAWLTPRPPELPDFHRAHSATAPPTRGVIVGLSQLMEPARQDRQQWLASLCQMELVDEGLIGQAAARMVQGTL